MSWTAGQKQPGSRMGWRFLLDLLSAPASQGSNKTLDLWFYPLETGLQEHRFNSKIEMLLPWMFTHTQTQDSLLTHMPNVIIQYLNTGQLVSYRSTAVAFNVHTIMHPYGNNSCLSCCNEGLFGGDLETWSDLMFFSRTACHVSCDILKKTVCKMLTFIPRSRSVGGHDIGLDHQLRRLATIHPKMCWESIFIKLYAPPLSSVQRSAQSILNAIIWCSTGTFTLRRLAKFTQLDRPTGDSLDLPSFAHLANYI